MTDSSEIRIQKPATRGAGGPAVAYCPSCCFLRSFSLGAIVASVPGAVAGFLFKRLRPQMRIVRAFDMPITISMFALTSSFGGSAAFLSYVKLGHEYPFWNGAVYKWAPGLNDAAAGAIGLAVPCFSLPILSTLLIEEQQLALSTFSHAMYRGIRGGIIGAAVGGAVGAYSLTKIYYHVLSRRALGFMCIPPVDWEKP